MGVEKVYNFKSFQKILKANGYKFERARGSHYIYNNGKINMAVPVRLKPYLAQGLIKEYNLEVEK